jgi:hypothetical protein
MSNSLVRPSSPGGYGKMSAMTANEPAVSGPQSGPAQDMFAADVASTSLRMELLSAADGAAVVRAGRLRE